MHHDDAAGGPFVCSFGVLTITYVRLQAMRLDKQMREQHVQHAVLCLNRKAAVLVEYVESEMCVTVESLVVN